MRVIVLGGTRFIGRAIVDALVAAGHDPLICHRGVTEADGPPSVAHLHAERVELGEHRRELEAFDAEAVVDCHAMSARDARALLVALPDPALHRVVLSSQDVYRAFATVQRNDLATDAVPITEDAPLRADRFPSRGEEGYEGCPLSPLELTRLFSQGATDAQGEALIAQYQGQWRDVSATVDSVIPQNTFITSVSSTDSDRVTVTFFFLPTTWAARLQGLIHTIKSGWSDRFIT
jgi:nucleoside-diphosphate-sugar epimerase